jgi:diguanylate cyclase (GGDEF)-like protein
MLPKTGLKLDIVASLSISVFIAGIGFFVIKEVFDRIMSISSEAKLIASGDIMRTIEAMPEDEVGDLGYALNQLTQCIRNNMDELKNYSEKTTQINLEIQKRILVLSSLLQISSLISQSAKIEDILKLTVEKSRFIANSQTSYLLFKEEASDTFFTKTADGVKAQDMLNLKIKFEESVFDDFIKPSRPIILDKERKLPPSLRAIFTEQFQLKNTLAISIVLKGKVIGILGIATTKEPFLYKKDDLELLDIFAKQVAIAVENDLLMHRIEKLEIKDPLTGLYNEPFIRNRLDEEIKRAIIYQRPCAFILLNIDNFKEFHQRFGAIVAESTLKKIAVLIRDSVTEIDRVGRIGDNEFAIVLPEKNKRQAKMIAEEMIKRIEYSFKEEQDINKRLTASGSVSENPLDGVEAEELIAKAKELIVLAKQQGKNRVAI